MTSPGAACFNGANSRVLLWPQVAAAYYDIGGDVDSITMLVQKRPRPSDNRGLASTQSLGLPLLEPA